MLPLMEPEAVMNLLDSFWCEQNVVSKNSCSSPSSAENQIQTSHARSMSDQSMTTKHNTAASIVKNMKKKRGLRRSSVSQLELKEVKGFMDLNFNFSEKDKNSRLASVLPGLKRLWKKREEKEEEHVVSRPYLSEAWDFIKEQKPFCSIRPPKNEKTGIKEFLRNMVFLIFSKEDEKSSLASIKIEEEEEEEQQVEEEEELDYDKALDKLMKWKLPAMKNEADMKSNLMSWVQTAAFIVR